MSIREKIMDLVDPYERHPSDGIVEQCADIAEKCEQELLAEIELQKSLREDAQEHHRQSMIELGKALGMDDPESEPRLKWVHAAVLGTVAELANLKEIHMQMLSEFRELEQVFADWVLDDFLLDDFLSHESCSTGNKESN